MPFYKVFHAKYINAPSPKNIINTADGETASLIPKNLFIAITHIGIVSVSALI